MTFSSKGCTTAVTQFTNFIFLSCFRGVLKPNDASSPSLFSFVLAKFVSRAIVQTQCVVVCHLYHHPPLLLLPRPPPPLLLLPRQQVTPKRKQVAVHADHKNRWIDGLASKELPENEIPMTSLISVCLFFKTGPFPASFYLFRLFNTVDNKQVNKQMFNILSMTGIELLTSGIKSDCSTNGTRTTSPVCLLFRRSKNPRT